MKRYYKKEYWKDIPEVIPAAKTNNWNSNMIYHINPIYQVSSNGRVRNKYTGRILSVREYNGYSQVTLTGQYEPSWMAATQNKMWMNQKMRPISLSVGRLVAAAFLTGEGLQPWFIVKHMDKDPHNNCLENIDIKY